MSCSLTSSRLTAEPFWFTNVDYRLLGSRFCMDNLGVKEKKKEYMKLCYKRREGENMRVGVSKQVVEITSKKEEVSSGGLGISSFIAGKVFLVTGATGFLAKVLVEKILRTIPDVGKIYLLIKANDTEEAMHRIKTEIINTELFKSLRQTHEESHEKFLLSKLVPVVGNLCADDLGMELDVAANIAEDVDIIINSAGNTNFHERYDVALNINTLGPYRLVKFAKKCKQLKLFMHVSTAYVNGEREGLIKEKLFHNGDSIAREKAPMRSSPLLDVEDEVKVALDAGQICQGTSVSRKMKQMGLEKAKSYGWQDTYVFTKAMGEMMIETHKENIPVVIIRPSIIESTYCEPIPGWIQGIRMADPFILSTAKGEITGFPVDVNGVIDIIPADMVVNAMLAATVKHATKDKSGGGLSSTVYHVASSVMNPLVYQDFFDYIFGYYDCFPYMNKEGKPTKAKRFKLFDNIDDFYTHINEAEATQTHQKSLGLAKIYGPYSLYKGRFDTSNTQELLEEMSEEERRSFKFNVRSLDWRDYFFNIHIPSMMTHEVKKKRN